MVYIRKEQPVKKVLLLSYKTMRLTVKKIMWTESLLMFDNYTEFP